MGVSIRNPGQRMFGGRANIADDEPLPRGGKFRPRQARSLSKDRSLRQMLMVMFHQVGHQLVEDRCGRERRMRRNIACGFRVNYGGFCVRHHQHQ